MGKLFRNWKARLVMAFVLTATLSIVATFASYRNVQRMESDSLLQTRTLAVIAQLETLRSDIKDAQRAERGYLITGNGNYLEPYHSATNSIGQSVDSLARLVSDSASQSTRVRQIKALVDEELAVIAAGITQRTASAPDAPPALPALRRRLCRDGDELGGPREDSGASSLLRVLLLLGLLSAERLLSMCLLKPVQLRQLLLLADPGARAAKQ